MRKQIVCSSFSVGRQKLRKKCPWRIPVHQAFRKFLYHSSISRTQIPDAVCRTWSPEAELLLVSGEPSTETERIASLETPDAASVTKLSELQGLTFPSSSTFSDRPSFHSNEHSCSLHSFPRDNAAGESMRSWTITCPDPSCRWSPALSYVLFH